MKNLNGFTAKRVGVRRISGIILLSVLVTVLPLALAGCVFFPGSDKAGPSAPGGNEFTRHDYLALLKTQENHKVSVEELQAIVSRALDAKPEGRSVAVAGGAVTGVKKVPLGGENRFALASAGRSLGASEEEPVEVYEFTVGGGEGFVLASNDVRIGHVLAVAEGSLDNTGDGFAEFLQACLEDYIAATIIEYDGISGADIEAAIEALEGEAARGVGGEYNPFGAVGGRNGWKSVYIDTDFSVVKNTILLTRWGQGDVGRYNGYVYNNYVQYVKGLQQLTGCGITAMAQIIAYHNYIVPPPSVPLPAAFANNFDLGTWGGAFDLSQIRALEAITTLSPAAARGQVGVLMYYLGLPGIANAVYDNNGATSTNIDEVRSAFIKLGYNVTSVSTATTITGPLNNFTITHNTPLATIKNALNLNRPIHIRGENQAGIGHAWVIDGYGAMSIYVEDLVNGSQYVYRDLLLADCVMVHCNFGWDGYADGWYVYGLFDADRTYSALGRSASGGAANFSTFTRMFIPSKP